MITFRRLAALCVVVLVSLLVGAPRANAQTVTTQSTASHAYQVMYQAKAMAAKGLQGKPVSETARQRMAKRIRKAADALDARAKKAKTMTARKRYKKAATRVRKVQGPIKWTGKMGKGAWKKVHYRARWARSVLSDVLPK